MKRNKGKRLSLLLTSAMLLGILPTTALAAQDTANQFVTKEQLITFNAVDAPEKVYFGNNDHQWYIAGSQSADSVVLFAASPIGSMAKFEENWQNPKKDPALWADCGYPEGQEIKQVSANHYGADSTLRNTLRNLEGSYFTSAEQSVMLPTTIYTKDTYNNAVYSVTETLYAPHGNDNRTVFVGANSADALDSGLVIGASCQPSRKYWLRTPDSNKSNNHDALCCTPSGYVSKVSVKNKNYVNPALRLDLTSVLFASSVPEAATDGVLTPGEVLTLRYASSSLGAAELSADKTTVTLTDVPADTYLVVYNGQETRAKNAAEKTSMTAADMGEGFTSFENCEVWLEQASASDNMVYAAMATEEVRYSVAVTENTGITVTSGNAAQSVKAGTEIEAITLQAGSEFVMPEGYEDTIEGLNGLTVTREGDTITISGTPDGDAAITLSALEYKGADYSKVDAVIEKANALNKDEYKDFSAVEAAIAAVVRDKNITEQETVDGYAEAIEKAISGLEKKQAEPTKPTDPTKPADPTKPTKPAKPVKPNTPHTGDNSNAVLWTCLSLLSLAGLAVVFILGRKRNKI